MNDPKKKVSNAMWKLWEDRVVELRFEVEHLKAKVNSLLNRNMALTQQLADNRIDTSDEPRCDVPDLGRIVAQHEEVNRDQT